MNERLTTFYIVRHGETEWNTKKLIQGHKDSPLTKNGVEQANELKEKFKDIKFDLVISSDLLRAKRTAEIIVAEHNLALETSQLLRERYFGKYQGKSIDALKAFDELFESLKEGDKFTYKDSDMESDEEISTRLITLLRETSITHPGNSILVVTHAGVMRAFLIKLGFDSYDELSPKKTKIENTAYIKVKSDGTDFFINDTKGITKT